ncbi:MAG TPA: hypothetical protein VIM70_03990 [Clostridium sp.]|uniref:hypothetical protein n=1 Tax=Clostridium sp. TaxID=1506 RepID=UPI002F95A6FA
MSTNNQVIIQLGAIKKIIAELDEIGNACFEPYLKIRVDELQSFISSLLVVGNISSMEDVIYEKMLEVKNTRPDLHFKLYMLYRDLVCGRISKEDASNSFESCLSSYPQDVMVY